MKNKKQYNLTKGLFVVYFLVLIWIILFKMVFSFEELGHIRQINLIPFGDSTIVNGKVELSEIINNMIIFIPFGIYICMLKPKWSFVKKVLPIFITSLVVEVLQFILAIGTTDITDLIGNTLGGIIGIGVFYVFLKLFKNKSFKVLNIIATIATIIILLFLLLLILAN